MSKNTLLPDARDFEAEIRRQWVSAGNAGASNVDIAAGDLHRSLGCYPGPNHRMPNCCSVMKRLMQPDDMILCAPLKGAGASLKIRYKIPRSTPTDRTI